MEAGYFGLVQALSRSTGNQDTRVAKHARNQIIHLRLLESTVINSLFLLQTVERRRSPYRLVKKIAKVDRSILSAKHAAGYALASNVLAPVARAVLPFGIFGVRFASVEAAVEGFLLIHPD
jgi:hypothetical protein